MTDCQYNEHGKYGDADMPARWEVVYFNPKGCGCPPVHVRKYFCSPCVGRIYSSRNGTATCMKCRKRGVDLHTVIRSIEALN